MTRMFPVITTAHLQVLFFGKDSAMVEKKKIVIIGSEGFIGTKLNEAFDHDKYDIMAVPRADYGVGNREQVVRCFDMCMATSNPISAVIYAVGHCPAGGFTRAVSQPLSSYSPTELERKINMHILGPFNVFQASLPHLAADGHYIFLSYDVNCLFRMHFGDALGCGTYTSPFAAVTKAQNELVEGMRQDPTVKKRKVVVSVISSPAITDSPFYGAGQNFPQPIFGVDSQTVVASIVACLYASDHQNLMLSQVKPKSDRKETGLQVSLK